MKRRVAITGLGAVLPVGNDLKTCWNNLIAGRGGIGRLTRFDPELFSSQVAGEVRDFDPSEIIDRKERRHTDRFVQYSWVASHEAYARAGLTPEKTDPNRFAVIIGSGIGGIETLEAQHRVLLDRGPSRVSPFFVPMMISDMASGRLSIAFNGRGPNFCTVSACASGAHAVGESYRLIVDDIADLAMAGGAEAPLTPLALSGFCSMKALSTRNDDPEHASRPFDRERDGFVMSEGAATVILEEWEHARARGAEILAELIGYGSTADAYHVTAPEPNGEGAARAMQVAMRDAGVAPDQIDYINAHGTSTPLNDKGETTAIRTVFGPHADRVRVSSTKSMTGHLLGAAGAAELLVCVMTLRHGIIAPTINYEVPDPDCDLDYVPNEARQEKIEIALTNSLGFGGHNVSLVVRAV
ncbi:MAG: beta-ketoacyl-ACP synthase II [Candidatus Eisenbacteria bacterium]|nr:beta-ketoacyl-ACP synthase II [Candidatus Eisenbacteria bacterium]